MLVERYGHFTLDLRSISQSFTVSVSASEDTTKMGTGWKARSRNDGDAISLTRSPTTTGMQ